MKRTLTALFLLTATSSPSPANSELQTLWAKLVMDSIDQHGGSVDHIKKSCDAAGCKTSMEVIYNATLLSVELIVLNDRRQFSLLCRTFPTELNCVDVDTGIKIVKPYDK